MNKLFTNFKSLVFKIFPIWFVYKTIYIKRYLKGLSKCEKQYDIDKNKRHFFIIGLPDSGNLGDQAIALSQIQFIKQKYKDCQLFVVYLNKFVDHWRWMKRYCGSDDVIFFQGGGNIGDEYARAEFARQICIHDFPDNRIFVFPQTYYFTSTFRGKTIKNKSAKIYALHDKLTLCARENKSYEQMKKIFFNNEIVLTPDIVFTYRLEKLDTSDKENKIVFCLRNDFEKKVTADIIQNMVVICKKEGYEVEFTDTVVDGKDYYDLNEMKRLVNKKIQELGSAKIVVTDRLHGMILSVLTNTNCIVLSNYNHKVKGVYDWIKKYEGVEFLEDANEFEKTLISLGKITYKFSGEELFHYFDSLEV